MLIPSPYPSPGNQVILDFDYPPDSPADIVLPNSPPHTAIVRSSQSDQNSDESWILGPWPTNAMSNMSEYVSGSQSSLSPPAPGGPPIYHRSQSQNNQVVPANQQFHGGSSNPFNYPSAGGMPPPQQHPNSNWMGYGPLPGGPGPQSPYMPSYPHVTPFHQGGNIPPQPGMMTPYMGGPPPGMGGMGGMGGGMGQMGMPGGWHPQHGGGAGALVPAGMGAMMPFQQKPKLARPKEEEPVAFDRWEPGKEYGIVLDDTQFDILKPPVAVHSLLGPTPPSNSHPSLIFDLLFPTNTIHLSTEPSHRSWMKGRTDPATFPRLTHIRLISPHFPWIIEVEESSTLGVGVTCGDVVNRIVQFFQRGVDKSEWELIPLDAQREFKVAYRRNRSTEKGVPGGDMSAALTRADMLGNKVKFGGLVRDDDYVKQRLGSLCGGATFVLLLHDR